MSEEILVTGGAGYIGSHIGLALLERDERVVVADDFSNSSPKSLDALRELSGRKLTVVEVDLANAAAVDALFAAHRFRAVIHLAGLKAVGESVQQPLRYYRNNLVSTLNILDAMRAGEVWDLVFSSSATVYGDPAISPMPESAPLRPTNPYGRTKHMIEEFCRDAARSDPRWRIAVLRYFNPVGAHPSGDLGEDPLGRPNNLVPLVTQVAVGRRDEIQVFGRDYDTRDGTGVRDYIHVVDLALGHIAALQRLEPGCDAFNLGTGTGASVLEVIETMQRVSGRPVRHSFAERRPGDVAASIADPSKAQERLGWKATRGLEEMLEDAWRWQSKHPHGFQGPRGEP